MRNLVLVSFCALFLTVIASAGIFRESRKVVASSAELGYKASAKSAKVASYPVRHPKKSAKKAAHAVKKVAY